MTSFQFVFWISSYLLLTLLLARYSPLYLCLFLLFCTFLSPYSAYFSVVSNFLERFFSTRFTPFTSCFLWLLSLSFQPISLKTLSPRTWIIKISSSWQSFKLCRYCCLASWLKILRITVQTTTSPIRFPAQSAGGKLFAQAVRISQPTWSPRVMLNRVPALRCT